MCVSCFPESALQILTDTIAPQLFSIAGAHLEMRATVQKSPRGTCFPSVCKLKPCLSLEVLCLSVGFHCKLGWSHLLLGAVSKVFFFFIRVLLLLSICILESLAQYWWESLSFSLYLIIVFLCWHVLTFLVNLLSFERSPVRNPSSWSQALNP